MIAFLSAKAAAFAAPEECSLSTELEQIPVDFAHLRV
jgi:hypothetical protein